MIKNKIQDDIKRAMKEKKPLVRDALRFVMSKVQQVEVDKRTDATDEIVIDCLKKAIKQNKDTLEYTPKDKQKLETEITVWEYYLPKQLSEEDTRAAMELIVKGHKLDNIKQMGQLMGAVRKQLGGTVDMAVCSKIAKELLT